jgi:hypothetical protein
MLRKFPKVRRSNRVLLIEKALGQEAEVVYFKVVR